MGKEPVDSDTDVDIDGVEGAAPQLGLQDLKGLNSKLTKLAAAHSIHLVQQDQLLLLLASLAAVMQQGDSLLIGTHAEVGTLKRLYIGTAEHLHAC